MKHITRAATAALTAAVALGISSPALATPGPGHGPGTHGPGTHGPQTSPGDRKFAIDQRNALREVARLDAQIARALVDSRVGKLAPVNGVDVTTAVLDNAAADRAALADIAATVQAATPGFDFKALKRDLHAVRPENYRIVVNALRRAAEVQAAADALGGVDEVTTAVDAAVAGALAITARSGKDEFKAVFAALEDAEAALEAAAAPTEDPTEDPADTDGDGLADADEATLGTDPTLADTDGGGASDGDEVADGTDPLDPTDDLV